MEDRFIEEVSLEDDLIDLYNVCDKFWMPLETKSSVINNLITMRSSILSLLNNTIQEFPKSFTVYSSGRLIESIRRPYPDMNSKNKLNIACWFLYRVQKIWDSVANKDVFKIPRHKSVTATQKDLLVNRREEALKLVLKIETTINKYRPLIQRILS